MRPIRTALLLLTALALTVSLLHASPAQAEKPGVPPPGPKERCPVCGMFVAPFPTWTAAARFADGAVVYFDGPKDLFRYTFDVAKFSPARKGQRPESLWFTEYYTSTWMPAAELSFAVGGDVLGPMGHELVPLRGEENAQTFRVDHRAGKILPFAEVTPAVISELP